MPSVAEILKQTGFTDEQIAAIDPKAVNAFGGVLSAAENERILAQQAAERAEIAKRSNDRFYAESVAPALNSWGSEKANLEGEIAYYRAQNEAARAAGFMPEEAPGFTPRDSQGRYVAGAQGGTPGSPTFTPADIQRQLATGLSNATWALQSYAKLYPGEVLPDPIDQLATEADAQRLSFRDYVAKKYEYENKLKAQQEKAQREHDDHIRADERAVIDRKWAEKIGSNPDMRIAQPSRYADVARAVKAGERPDPLALNESQRKQATRQAIRHEMVEGTA